MIVLDYAVPRGAKEVPCPCGGVARPVELIEQDRLLSGMPGNVLAFRCDKCGSRVLAREEIERDVP